MVVPTILLTLILQDHRKNHKDQLIILDELYTKYNHTVNKKMAEYEVMLTKICPFHPNPPFPKGREGVLFLLKRDIFAKMAETYTGNAEALPLLPSGKEGAGENGERNMTPLMYKGKMVGALREDVEIENVEPGVVRKTPKGIKVQLLYGDEPVGFLLISEIEKI